MQIGESVILVKGAAHVPSMDQYLGMVVTVAVDLGCDLFTTWENGPHLYAWEYKVCKAEYDRQMAAGAGHRVTGTLSVANGPTTSAEIIRYGKMWDDGKTAAPSSAGGGCQHDLIPSALSHGQLWCRKCGYKPESEVRP